MRAAGEQVANGAAGIGKRAGQYLENHSRAQATVARGQAIAAKGAQKLGAGARGAGEALPGWSANALRSVRQTVGRVSRAGLSSQRVVKLHRKRGHEVEVLSDVRRLDLQQVDAVRGRGASWYYPAMAGLSGAGAGLVISGGELATAVSAGAAAAPSGGAIAGAFIADAAFVLGLASRCVGQVSLTYGYDPEEPAEKLFVMSVVNFGTASTAATKTAAMSDVSRLTQALVRGKTWEKLNESIVSQVAVRFADAFGVNLTKKGLGKAVPAVGIVVGGALNWTTLEGIVDAADMAYRRRFLLEKYPQLDSEEVVVEVEDLEEPEEGFSVIAEITDAGGPDLR
nr:EcsC family protein [Kineosporia babensis]